MFHPCLFSGCCSRSNGQTKKLTVGVLQLSAEVTHYVVPAKESAAYLQAKVRECVVGACRLQFKNRWQKSRAVTSVVVSDLFTIFSPLAGPFCVV